MEGQNREHMIQEASSLAEWLLSSPPVVVLSGAGISTESGIPDFRSPGSGLWTQVDPMEILSVTAMQRDPRRFWEFKLAMWRSFCEVEPNPAHTALAELESMGVVDCVATQNIDSLHTRAGSRNVLEVHGHMRTGRCTRCYAHLAFEILAEKAENGEVPPLCECGGILRPDVVLFEDMLPEAFQEAAVKAARCGFLLVIGSSLEVAPVSYLPGQARRLGILNVGSTMYDEDACWRGGFKAGEFMPLVVEACKKHLRDA